MEAQNGFEPTIGAGQEVYYDYDGSVELTDADGSTIETPRPEHHGGYDQAFDTYFDNENKDGAYSSGHRS